MPVLVRALSIYMNAPYLVEEPLSGGDLLSTVPRLTMRLLFYTMLTLQEGVMVEQ